MNKEINKSLKRFVDNFKRPVFILGLVTWAAIFTFMTFNSFTETKTGNVIANNSALGLTGSEIVVLIFVVLSILMFLIWQYLIRDLRKTKKHKKR